MSETIEDQITDAHPRPASAASLLSFDIVVLEGPDAGVRVSLDAHDPLRLLAGQSPACQLRLTDHEVSRRHAAFHVEGDRLRLTDLGSTNGTIVDGLSVGDAFLQGGERVRLGATVLRVSRRNEPVARDAPLDAADTTGFGFVMGASEAMRRLYPLCARLAATTVPLIIEGETGTGKEVLAESIHNAGPRASGPFIVFDCTAVPDNLIEAELFGHEKGAFTGAATTRRGMFEQANGGTLLIDEIGDLGVALQPKLLRAVERCEIRRLGGERSIRVDARIMAATRRDLDREVLAGRFRDDLFHRLAVARVELPPLRERRGDVSRLAGAFCRELGVAPEALPADVLSRWEDATWPGNVRELRNAVARWVALGEIQAPLGRGARRGELTGEHVSADFTEETLALRLPLTQARHRVIENFDRRYIDRVLAEQGGHVGRAAAASGIGRRYFQMLLARKP
jgi:two-component system response regulator HydG